jgi:glycosyltransferase involved in cell wall biosynthesis
MPESKLSPKGGQEGYLYNLREGLRKTSSDEVEISFYNNAPKRFEDNSKLKSMVPKRVLDFRRALNDTRIINKRFAVDEELHKYDMIHFHWTEEMYMNRDFLKDYKGKVILTSHSPCVYYKEKIGKLRPSDYKLFKKKIDKMEEMDIYAFERADYVIFPCEDAEEPYFHTWDKYEEIRKKPKYYYMPTGIIPCSAKRSREDVRKEYNIPEDAFLVSYAGRHNEIKGYADLKKIGCEMLKDKDVYFIIAGREGPIYRLNHDRWIEVGWTNDPHSLIAASDVFVLPNHETYFDLILLEVISLGVPVVLSETGGNKFFKKYNSGGFIFYKTVEQAVENLKKLKNLNPEQRELLGKDVKRIFDEDFTVETFAKNYIETINKIAKD